MISAVGQPNRPFVPDVPGEFAGPAFHTARWRHDIDLSGKDVVMVGAGATGFQLAPAIADRMESLTAPTGKRALQDNGSWLRTLRRDHVHLVRAGAQRLTEDGIVDSTGTFHRADVIVWATGFRPNDFLTPLRVTGRDLHRFWGERPRAHLCVTLPGFPNFFLLYGPGTNLASGGSIIFAAECAVRLIMCCLRMLTTSDGRRIEVRAEAFDAYTG